jgi:hypothetical protein
MITFIFLAYDFLAPFLFLVRFFSCILHVYLGCAIAFFNEISITYPKNIINLVSSQQISN